MDVHELATYLGIPISTVYDWRVHAKARSRTGSAST
jgi:hypothetical protein